MLQNYRTSDNPKEIIKIIKRSSAQDECYVWHNVDGNRIMLPISRFEVNDTFMTLDVYVDRCVADIIESGETIYVKFSYRDTVFKAYVLTTTDEKITFEIPSEVKTLEMRSAYRFKFKPSETKHVTVAYEVDLVMKAKRAMAFQVIDISESGLSIVSSDKDLKLFEDGGEFDLTRLLDMDLASPYKIEYIYHQKFRFKNKGRVQTAYRIGFRTDKPISKVHLEYFTLV